MNTPSDAQHRDRRRAESFGAVAALYDRTRPSYAPALIEWLSRNGAGHAVDIGTGTGRVAHLLKASGWEVRGVEPDARMADVARALGLSVDVATFEQWDASGVQVDLITAGTSWHWVDPIVGYAKAASILRTGGTLAILRNTYRYTGEMAAIITQTFSKHAPRLLSDCVPLGTADPNRIETHRPEIRAHAELFHEPDHRVFPHERTVHVDDWLGELRTHSPVMLIDPEVSAPLFEDLRARICAMVGETIHIDHETHGLFAERR